MNKIECISEKVQKTTGTSSYQCEMILPIKNYQPFVMKVINDFIIYNNLPDLEIPKHNITLHYVFCCIVDIMAHSMGTLKKKELIEELKEYTENS